MKGLLIKDLRYLRLAKKFVLVFLLLSTVYMLIFKSPFFFVGFFTAGGLMMTISGFAYDDYDNGGPFLYTLPIGRRDYVREKYLFSFGMTTAGWLFSVLVYNGYFLAVDRQLPSLIHWTALLGIYGVYLLFCSVLVPVSFKFGAEKMGLATMAIFGGAFLVIYLLNRALGHFGINLTGRVNQLVEQSPVLVILVLIVLVLLALAISYRISIRLLLRKEF